MKQSINQPIISITLIVGLLMTACNNQSTPTPTENTNEIQTEIDYLKIGKEIAIKTKSNLSKNLIAAIEAGGSEGAVEFCNIKAMPIMDSMSLALDAKIKRVSDQPRNPKNKANEAELDFIQKWKKANSTGKLHPPVVNEIDGKMVAFYPIVTNQMCLQCHGNIDNDINTATLAKIKKLYPADQATGYADNEIRGLFVVEMNKK
jgi:hypothetical protein